MRNVIAGLEETSEKNYSAVVIHKDDIFSIFLLHLVCYI